MRLECEDGSAILNTNTWHGYGDWYLLSIKQGDVDEEVTTEAILSLSQVKLLIQDLQDYVENFGGK